MEHEFDSSRLKIVLVLRVFLEHSEPIEREGLLVLIMQL